MVETAMTWSGSVAWRMPRKKPMARMANPLIIESRAWPAAGYRISEKGRLAREFPRSATGWPPCPLDFRLWRLDVATRAPFPHRERLRYIAGDMDVSPSARMEAIEPVMVRIPEGWFSMGCENGRDDEKPVHRVWVDAFELAR